MEIVSVTEEALVSECVHNAIQYFNHRGYKFNLKKRVSSINANLYSKIVVTELEMSNLKNKYKLLSRKFHGTLVSKKISSGHGKKLISEKLSFELPVKKKSIKLFGFN